MLSHDTNDIEVVNLYSYNFVFVQLETPYLTAEFENLYEMPIN